MTTKDTALRLALEALEVAPYMSNKDDHDHHAKAITAIREALAQPAGERGELVQDIHLIQTKMVGSMLFDQTDVAVLSKAAALLSSDAQPAVERGEFQKTHLMLEAENAGFVTLEGYVHSLKTKLATALLSSDAQPSEWVGLSDEEIQDVWCSAKNEAGQYGPFWFARAIEAKLKEKNHVK